MKRTAGSRKGHYIKGVGVVLIVVTLIAGMAGCPPPVVNELVYHSLAIASTEGGQVSAPGEGSFNYSDGTVAELEAVADEGHRFVIWTGDVGTVADVNAASTTITMDDNYSITANFEEMPEETPAVEYELMIDSTEGGEVTVPGEGVFAFDDGEVINLVVEVVEGYEFVHWTGDVSTVADIKAASTTITMDGDYSITASFNEIANGQYKLTILNAGGGSVAEPGEGGFRYEAGTVVDLMATPGSGYEFVNWTGDVDTVVNADAAATTVSVNSDLFIIANFRGEGFRLHCGGVLDPEGWWYYSVEWNAELDVEWHETLYIRSPDRFISDTSKEAPMWGGRSSVGSDGWHRIFLMTEEAGGEERQVIVASWSDKRVFRAGLFIATEENVQALIRESMELDGPSGEFRRFVRDAVELSSDVIAGWTAHWEGR